MNTAKIYQGERIIVKKESEKQKILYHKNRNRPKKQTGTQKNRPTDRLTDTDKVKTINGKFIHRPDDLETKSMLNAAVHLLAKVHQESINQHFRGTPFYIPSGYGKY